MWPSRIFQGESTLYILEIMTRCHKAVEYEFHTCTPKFSNLNTVFWIWCSDWLTFSNSKNFMSEWVIVVKCHLSNVSAISWREHVNYVSPSNEGRHIVLVWFFLLLLLSEACPNHNFFVFPDRSIIFCMWVHDHKAVCRVP